MVSEVKMNKKAPVVLVVQPHGEIPVEIKNKEGRVIAQKGRPLAINSSIADATDSAILNAVGIPMSVAINVLANDVIRRKEESGPYERLIPKDYDFFKNGSPALTHFF